MIFARVNKKALQNIDWPLVSFTLILCGIGLVLLYSAGYDPSIGMSRPMRHQSISMLIGFAAFLICMFIDTTTWKRWSYLLYFLGCILLLLIFFNGVVAGGARRWLQLGGFRMQPSEFMKLGLILALARLFSREKAPVDGYNLSTMILPGIILLVPVLLIIKEPDLGTALCHVLIGGTMLLIAGVQWRTFLRVFAAAAVLMIPAWNFVLKEYQKQRILTFLSPEADPLGSGYHAIQSKIAVGSGALIGKGFLKGTQTQLSFLPEQTTDFIFSVLAEEWGFLGTSIVLVLYGLLIVRLLKIASRCSEPYPAFVAIGVAALLFWHVVINIGMVVGVLPVVGLTLALLSFGGSSVVTVLAALGIVSGFSMRRYMFS